MGSLEFNDKKNYKLYGNDFWLNTFKNITCTIIVL